MYILLFHLNVPSTVLSHCKYQSNSIVWVGNKPNPPPLPFHSHSIPSSSMDPTSPTQQERRLTQWGPRSSAAPTDQLGPGSSARGPTTCLRGGGGKFYKSNPIQSQRCRYLSFEVRVSLARAPTSLAPHPPPLLIHYPIQPRAETW